MTNLNIVILAAGVGKRMQSSQPKVLHVLAGKPLLGHVLDVARALSPKKICVVYGHGGERVPRAINDSEIIWVKQEVQLGTGHALLQTLPYLDTEGVTLVLLGDVPLIKVDTLGRLIAKATENNFALLTAELDAPLGYGRIIRNEATGTIQAIVEEKDASKSQLEIQEINTGIMVLPNSYLHEFLPKLQNKNSQSEYYLTDIIEMAVEAGLRVDASYPVHGWEILGVNSKANLAKLERINQREYANELLEQGVMITDPSRIDVRGQLVCGRNVEIDINCIFEGTVHLGDDVKIGAHCILRNVVVSSGTTIFPFSLIENAEIGKNCHVGPYSRIRPGTRLYDEAHIGNFVEVKNSNIGMGSKANHLSYIGDAIIGTKVNIGAGTITCNYDGAFKHQTIIEDDVFVGSDTQLVAPIRVARGSTIGAGSTITRDTPEDQLTLSRSKQVSVTGWKRPKKNKT
ncbi:bifunctional UDP-N-acetylglucosamine diphosphorylase/glucosamine-1-phosphate N-acetyltransferase GlmU [Nitrosomonas sp. Nm132]|uniref:bifunctional UDP-N-acetylglucosamine diphosphorylase/glucosamine-1-phosphate N-acetyltransferase GlmU n=1 Tax=Nitrosomonas sp. Nm132 TaxID=1881053 RepID=UPI0008839957|nr:bifunctional UDP-N-acetylglucosamine diphosphorylase/glucosamine-1-phosphate N-acetyltransferase GlmU [Nitrosomonas sp. Nm132]SDH02761.1 bifunctional UDP-N-acetylglucosamine pyrophosphorylase / Glucosamine-1-phosphate N-acetyltransferase [Nitrosomonas sp. Nm132]